MNNCNNCNDIFCLSAIACQIAEQLDDNELALLVSQISVINSAFSNIIVKRRICNTAATTPVIPKTANIQAGINADTETDIDDDINALE